MSDLDLTDDDAFEASLRALATDPYETLNEDPKQRIPMVERIISLNKIYASLKDKPKADALIYAFPGEKLEWALLEWAVCPIGDSLVVGRDPKPIENGGVLRLDEPRLSRSHFAIVRDEGLYRLRDLNSRNGILLNSSPAKIKEHFLASSDLFSAGGVLFFFVRG